MDTRKIAETANVSKMDGAIVTPLDLLELVGDPNELPPDLDRDPAFQLLLLAILGGCADLRALVSYGESECPMLTLESAGRIALRMHTAAKIALAHRQRSAA